MYMKRFYVLLFVSLMVVSCKSTKNQVDPDIYYNKVEDYYEMVNDAEYSLDSLINSYDFTQSQINLKFKHFDSVYNVANLKVTKLKSYNGDKSLQKALIAYFNRVHEVVNNDYKDLYKLYDKPFEEWSEEDFSKMYDLLEQIDTKIYEKEKQYSDAQSNFVSKYM